MLAWLDLCPCFTAISFFVPLDRYVTKLNLSYTYSHAPAYDRSSAAAPPSPSPPCPSHKNGAASLSRGSDRRGTTASTRWKSASLRPSSCTVSLSGVWCVGFWLKFGCGWMVAVGDEGETNSATAVGLTDQHRAHSQGASGHQVLEAVLEENDVVVRRANVAAGLPRVRAGRERGEHLLEGRLRFGAIRQCTMYISRRGGGSTHLQTQRQAIIHAYAHVPSRACRRPPGSRRRRWPRSAPPRPGTPAPRGPAPPWSAAVGVGGNVGWIALHTNTVGGFDPERRTWRW